MWLIELNVAGRRLTLTAGKHRRRFGLAERAMPWRGASLRQSPAA